MVYEELIILSTYDHRCNKGYLILLSVSLGVVRVWVVLKKLSHIRHNGFLVRLVHVHIYNKATQTFFTGHVFNSKHVLRPVEMRTLHLSNAA